MLRILSLTFALAGCTAAGVVTPQPDLATLPDLATVQQPDLGADLAGPPYDPPRADPWPASGGGSVSAGGRQLNLTVGGGPAGRAAAGNGAVITFGAFCTQTY
jgi:hypothetical protein